MSRRDLCPCSQLEDRVTIRVIDDEATDRARNALDRLRCSYPAVIAVCLAGALLIAACGAGSTSATSAGAPRLEVAAGEARVGALALNEFGWDLYRELGSGNENLILSPFSVGVALTMTRTGASADTAAAMTDVLRLESVDDANLSLNALDRAFEASSRTTERPDGSEAEVVVESFNALWAQEGFGFEEPFLVSLAENYGAGVRLVDYRGDAEGARQSINSWVANETRDRIEDLIPAGVLSELTRLVLTNAVYLKAPWENPFDEQLTSEGVFELLDGSEKAVDLMATSGSFRFARDGPLQALELPYAGGDLALLVLIPDSGTFPDVVTTIDSRTVDSIVDQLDPVQIDLRFPRFEFTTEAALVPALSALGMEVAFDPDRADFSDMTTEDRLFISAVMHEAFISVDESGTEAAAATAVVMDLTVAAEEPLSVVVDRPFIVVVRHLETSGNLFIGHVVNP